MTILETTYLGNPVLDWLIAAAMAAVVFIALAIAKRLAIGQLARVAEKTDTELDDVAVTLLRATHPIFLLLLSLYAGSLILALPEKAALLINQITVIALLIQVAIWGNYLITFLIAKTMKKRGEKDTASIATVTLIGFIVRAGMWSIIVLMALDNLGFNITALIAGLGIGGVAVALAAQNVLSDLFASVSIVLDKPFVIGDFIIVGELMGTVEHIGIKTTLLRSLSGEQLVFANADLLQSRIRNYKRMFERRVVFNFGVIYQTPYEKLAAIPQMVREVIEPQARTRFDRAHFYQYGDSSLNFEVVYYVKSPDYNVYMDIHQAVHLAIYRKFGTEGIEFAYPTRTLYLQKT
jgi:small-conductance mechanosensitive channel